MLQSREVVFRKYTAQDKELPFKQYVGNVDSDWGYFWIIHKVSVFRRISLGILEIVASWMSCLSTASNKCITREKRVFPSSTILSTCWEESAFACPLRHKIRALWWVTENLAKKELCLRFGKVGYKFVFLHLKSARFSSLIFLLALLISNLCV